MFVGRPQPLELWHFLDGDIHINYGFTTSRSVLFAGADFLGELRMERDSAESPDGIVDFLGNQRRGARRAKEYGIRLAARAIYECVYGESNGNWFPVGTAMLALQATELLLKARICQLKPNLLTTLTSYNDKSSNGQAASHNDERKQLDTGCRSLIQTLAKLELVEGGDFEQITQYAAYCDDICFSHEGPTPTARKVLKFLIDVLEPLIHKFWRESALPVCAVWSPDCIREGILEVAIFTAGIEITPNVRRALGDESEVATASWKQQYQDADFLNNDD